MSYQLLIIFILQTPMLNGAPLLIMPYPLIAQSAQQIELQKQLMELQALQQLSAQSPVLMNNQPQPLMILLPKHESTPIIDTNERHKHESTPIIDTNERHKAQKENTHKTMPTNLEYEDEDLNSVIIDAASETTENYDQVTSNQPQRAILLIPNARFSIGGIVSAIPWLPIEINVPDTISWAYNGIATGIGSIISIIGRPFQGVAQGTQAQEEGLKAVLKRIQTNQNMLRPIVIMPIDGPVLPIQV